MDHNLELEQTTSFIPNSHSSSCRSISGNILLAQYKEHIMLSYLAFIILCTFVVTIVMTGLFCMLHSSMCDKYNELFKELANLKKE